MADTDEIPTSLDARGYLKNRVQDQLNYYARGASRAKRMHFWSQGLMIILAAAVPVVVNLPGDSLPFGVTMWGTAMSLIVAVLGGLTNFRKDGDLWLNYRMTEELLKQELFLFQTSAGPYLELGDNEQERLAELALRVERLISAEHNKFRSLVEDSKRPTKTRQEAKPEGG